MEPEARDPAPSGRERALQLVETLAKDKSFYRVPAAFARIIIDLFPDWFDFGADKFSVLSWERGLHLIVSGQSFGIAIMSTSDSRCMSCITIGRTLESARMDMHYEPFADQRERAQTVIRMALSSMFPGKDELPEEMRKLIPEGRVFPTGWDGRITPSEAEHHGEHSAENSRQQTWWKLWKRS